MAIRHDPGRRSPSAPATSAEQETEAARPRLVSQLPRRTYGARGYAAGLVNDLTYSWGTAPQTADQVVHTYLRTLRARARHEYADNDYARRFVGLVKTNVIGPDGFAFQARTVDAEGQPDRFANGVLESHWRAWSKARYCHAQGQLGLVDFLRLWIATVATDGEAIVRRRLGPQYGRYQFALQLIDPELLDVAHHEQLRNGNRVVFGIEYDAEERPVAYWFRAEPVTSYGGYAGSTNRTRVPAEEILHHYLVERVGQKRGIPWTATPLQALHMLDGYAEAALVAARVGASKALFYAQDPDADPNIEGLATLKEQGRLVDEVDPGSATVLPPGVQMQAYDPTYPHSDYAQFNTAQLQRVAAGLGVTHHALSGDLSEVNYSSAKIGEVAERELWKSLQRWVADSLLEPLYEAWLDWQLALGTLRAGTGNAQSRPLRPELRDKYLQVRLIGRRWQFNEPLKEAQAAAMELENRITSPQRVMRERGLDPDEVIEDWQQWHQKLDAAGLLPTMNQGKTPNADPQIDETD